MTNINDFSINVPEEKLEDLKKRLELTRWPDKETPPDWTQGCLLYTSPSPRDQRG